MFNLFKGYLEDQTPPTVQVIVFTAAGNYLKETIEHEAKRIGQKKVAEDPDYETFLDMNELYYGYLFGRMVSQIDSKKLPGPPDLLANVDGIKTALITGVAPVEDGYKPNIEDYNSISHKVIYANSHFSGGRKTMVNTAFKIRFKACMIEMGFPEDSAEKLAARFGDEVDEVINEICGRAREIWDDIPKTEEDITLEKMATGIRKTISEINNRKSFAPTFQKADVK